MELADIFQAADASGQDNSYSVSYLVKVAVIFLCSFYIFEKICNKILFHEADYTLFTSFVEN